MNFQTRSRAEKRFPGDISSLRRVSFALQRGGVRDMEELCRIQTEQPDRLMNIRGIGEKSLKLIEGICAQYRE